LGGITTLALTQAIILLALFFLVCAPVHEAAHGFVAWKKGDGTARLFGRVTLDPFAHFDPVGGSIFAVLVLFSVFTGGGGFVFGWAKPTPVNPYNLRGKYADSLVALAGPLSNLVLAVLFAIGFRIAWANGLYPSNDSLGDLVCLIMWMGITVNVSLLVFNLIPIPPLDGSHILLDMVSPRTRMEIQGFLTQYGMIFLLIVVMFLGQVIGPILRPIIGFLAGVPVY
jgi:Zn-dependent protease